MSAIRIRQDAVLVLQTPIMADRNIGLRGALVSRCVIGGGKVALELCEVGGVIAMME